MLARRDILLSKSLGQNFLHDRNQLRRIIELAQLSPGDQVLEIGPGLGPLTELLLDHAGSVRAIERDARLADLLEERLGDRPNLQIVRADALDYLRDQALDWSGWKVVSNLPYSVASPILVELAQHSKCPCSVVVTLQLEVAQRLMARAGDESYGLLSLLVQLRYAPAGWFRIPAGCFFPEPDVESASVRLERRNRPLLAPELEPVFKQIVRRGFSQRRKKMFKLLKEDWPPGQIAAAFQQLGISEQARAEEVGLDPFVRLAQLLKSAAESGPKSRNDLPDGRRDI